MSQTPDDLERAAAEAKVHIGNAGLFLKELSELPNFTLVKYPSQYVLTSDTGQGNLPVIIQSNRLRSVAEHLHAYVTKGGMKPDADR